MDIGGPQIAHKAGSASALDGEATELAAWVGMPGVRVDKGCWPIVLCIFNGVQHERDVEAYIATMDRIYDEGEPFLGVSFMIRYRSDIAQLRRVAAWTRERGDTVAKLCRANAIVAPTMGFRFMFTTFLMLQPMPCPYAVVASTDAASDWLERELPASVSLQSPPRARQYLKAEMLRETR